LVSETLNSTGSKKISTSLESNLPYLALRAQYVALDSRLEHM